MSVLNMTSVVTATIGTGAISLGAAVNATFVTDVQAGAVDQKSYHYHVQENADFMIVSGVYTTSGRSITVAKVLLSSIAGVVGATQMTLGGAAVVTFVALAEDFQEFSDVRETSGTSDTIHNADGGGVVLYSNAAAVAVSIGAITGLNFKKGWFVFLLNYGVGAVTITPTTVSILNNAPIAQNMGAILVSDGANYLMYYVPLSKPLMAGNNLADISSQSIARTNLGSTTVGDALFIAPSVASALATLSSVSYASQTLTPGARGQATLNLQQSFKPQGRLYIATGVPVISANVSAQTSTFYGPYDGGNVMPLYDGTTFNPTLFSEVSQLLSDTTKSPAAAVAATNYDLFAWLDGSTFRVTRGPGWTNATTRASTLTNVNGLWLNTSTITNGPAASRGTYVGTVRTRAADGLIDYSLGGAASGGTAGIISVWNAYNRVPVSALVEDTFVNATITAGTISALNSSTNNRVSYVIGLPEEAIEGRITGTASAGSGGISGIAIGHDSTSAITGLTSSTQVAAASPCSAEISISGDLGFHFAQALQFASNANGIAYGIGTGLNIHTGLVVRFRA